MKSLIALAFTVAMLTLASPASAGIFNGAHAVTADDPNVPNCTVINPVPGCERVLLENPSNNGGHASCPCPWETFTDEHCVK